MVTQTYTQTNPAQVPVDIELKPIRPAYTGGRDKLRNSDPDVASLGRTTPPGAGLNGAGDPVPGPSIPATPSLSVADALSLSHIDASFEGERVTPILHPPDRGRHAWQFLAAATLVETWVWGLPVSCADILELELTAVHGWCVARVLALADVPK